MLRGLWTLTWLETKIFVREPLGVFGTVGVPVVIFVLFGRFLGSPVGRAAADAPRALTTDLPILGSLLITIGTVTSLVAIIAIYREGGILRRVRATPLRPYTILSAHVLVKLLFTAVTFALMLALGRRYYAIDPDVPVVSFAAAVLFSTVSVLSLGFVIASIVPTARFAQPFGTLVLYPMLGVSGLFVPIKAMPPALQVVSRALPLTYAVSLQRGVWHGEGWIAHAGDVLALLVMLIGFTAISARVFRWE